jgi:thioredoxin 1
LLAGIYYEFNSTGAYPAFTVTSSFVYYYLEFSTRSVLKLFDFKWIMNKIFLMKTFIKIIFSLFLLQSVLFAAGKTYSQTEFDKLIKDGKPVVLHVHAKWCSTCATQDPILNSLMKTPEFKNFTFYNVDFDTSKDLLKTLKVSRQSAIIVFKQGKEQGRSLGDTKESSIKELLKKAI